jgi:DUF1009 family protein
MTASAITEDQGGEPGTVKTIDGKTIVGPIGLIAGNGEFPIEFARNARERGVEVIAVAHQGETNPELAKLVSSITWVKIGQLGKIIRTLKKSDVKSAVMLGGITKVKVFENVRLDLRAVKMLARIRSMKDDQLLRGIADVIEREGVEIISATDFLPECIARTGQITHRALTEQERSDAALGWQVAEASGRLDVGQSVVVHGGITLAVEAVEGTDEMIARAGILSRKQGGVLVKLAKPQQDLRLDLPAIGSKTIESMEQAGLTALVLQHERALILKPEEVRRAAEKAGIALMVVKDYAELGTD